jgi:S-adenosylmethionine decarboxylase
VHGRPNLNHPGTLDVFPGLRLPVQAGERARDILAVQESRLEEDGALKNPALGYGMHLTLDGYDCSPAKLANLDVIYEFLDHCPDLITMTKIMPPYVFKYQAQVPEDWGVSGFVLIAESHISVHTYPEKAYLSLDIFSCKDFDHQKAVAYATELFGIGRHELNLLNRGQEFPREVKVVERLLRQERQRLRV